MSSFKASAAAALVLVSLAVLPLRDARAAGAPVNSISRTYYTDATLTVETGSSYLSCSGGPTHYYYPDGSDATSAVATPYFESDVEPCF